MDKITTTFTDGQILHAADLNPLVESINQAADEIATKAEKTDLDNTTQTANNANASAIDALTLASEAKTEAHEATEIANTASQTADQAAEIADMAEANATNAIALTKGAVRMQYIEVIDSMPTVDTSSATSYIAIVYCKATKTLLAKSLYMFDFKFHTNWPDANIIGLEQTINGWTPRDGMIFVNTIDDVNIEVYLSIQGRLRKLEVQ